MNLTLRYRSSLSEKHWDCLSNLRKLYACYCVKNAELVFMAFTGRAKGARSRSPCCPNYASTQPQPVVINLLWKVNLILTPPNTPITLHPDSPYQIRPQTTSFQHHIRMSNTLFAEHNGLYFNTIQCITIVLMCALKGEVMSKSTVWSVNYATGTWGVSFEFGYIGGYVWLTREHEGSSFSERQLEKNNKAGKAGRYSNVTRTRRTEGDGPKRRWSRLPVALTNAMLVESNLEPAVDALNSGCTIAEANEANLVVHKPGRVVVADEKGNLFLPDREEPGLPGRSSSQSIPVDRITYCLQTSRVKRSAQPLRLQSGLV